MMTDIEEMAKACFDRQEWERHEDRPSHIIEKWDDIDDTAKEYWREFVKPLLSFIRAAELRGRVAGMREAALIAGHSKIITHNVVLNGDTIPSTEWCRDPNAQEIYAAINSAATKLESSPTT